MRVPTERGAETGSRTRDLVITNDVLCQLSYLGTKKGLLRTQYAESFG